MRNRTGKERRSPWLTLVPWALMVAALALLGTGVAKHLSPTSLAVPGTPSAKADAMLDREFGNQLSVTVLLQGPAAAVDRQGPRLVAALRAEGDVQVMSPWSGGGGMLRPEPDAALIVASFQRPDAAAMTEVVPSVRRLVGERVGPPVRAHVGGMAAIATALQENALSATRRAELLAAPILIVVLLLVFRSPVAAVVPLLMGAATVLAGRGLLLLGTYVMPINSLAVAIASMMGLALGVDYALLMVSRFRQEREAGASVDAAIDTATRVAGRTIVFAGGTLALAMMTAAIVAPGDMLGSVAAGVVLAALLGVLLAVAAMPSLIRILSPYIDRWRLPGLGGGDRMLGAAGGLIARPWVAIPLIMLPLLAVAAPAAALTIGPPDPRQLPADDETRQGFEALRKTLGPGWVAPIGVVATAREGTISDPGRLSAIARWQERISRDPAVEAVIGPASLRGTEETIDRGRRAYREAPERLAAAEHGIGALRTGLRRAGAGVEALRAGLGSAADGAAAIAGGTRQARDGAGRLEQGLGAAGDGAERLSKGLDEALEGAGELVGGQRRLGRGAERLARGMRQLDRTLQASLGEVREVGERLRAWSAWLRALRVPTELAADRLERAVRDLEGMTVGREDPRFDALVESIREASALVGPPSGAMPDGSEPALPQGVSTSLAAAIVEVTERLSDSVDSLAAMPERLDELAAGVQRLRDGADEVAEGSLQTEHGGRELRAALRRLADGGRRLNVGLEDAEGGGRRLAVGLDELTGGAARLSDELGDGKQRSGALSEGLDGAQEPLADYAVTLHGYREALDSAQRRSPHAIDSGYLMLTALDGTVPALREQIAQMLNVDSGGEATRMLVVPAAGPNDPRTRRLADRLESQLPALARTSHTVVGIGEGAKALADYTEATMDRLPWLILSLCAVSVLMLVMVLRSLLLPLVAVALNLLTIAAALGVLQILFDLDLLAGPPYIDAISGAGVITIMFVLSVDYEVFLLTRMREIWLRTGDHVRAIGDGLSSTAGVITGAAAIMSSVFVAFAITDIASLQQFGIGLTFAVILDATVVRVVLLPAIMRALGRRAWWLPGWLDRCLPVLDHGDGASRPAMSTASDATTEVSASPPPPPVPSHPHPAPIEEFEAVSRAEHRRILDLLTELEFAAERRDGKQLARVVREVRALAVPHFRYEQQALFPDLAGALRPEALDRIHAEQDDTVEALERIAALAGHDTIDEPEATEARRLVHAARASVVECDSACHAMGARSPEVAERVLAARERLLSAAEPTWPRGVRA